MNTSDKTVLISRYNTIYFCIILFWTGLIVALAVWHYQQAFSSTVQVAKAAAYESFSKDLLYRRWVTMHGGIYAPITSETPPNPYLAGSPERDISTPSGRKLTLINPAYMTRQVHELGKRDYGARGHITSLKLLRPENAPDNWERSALQAFEQGKKEIFALEPIYGESYFRLMRPLTAEAGRSEERRVGKECRSR